MLAKPLDFSAIDPPDKPRAVVILLHGFGANAADFRSFVPQLGLPEALSVRFVFPQAPQLPVSVMGGRTMPAWFDFQPGGGVDLASLAALAVAGLSGSEPIGFGSLVESSVKFPGLEKATLWVRDVLQSEIDNGVPADRIVLAGFSQGGALALNTGLFYPKRLAGILALSTFLADGSRLGSPRARSNNSTPILMCHGQQDAVLPASLGKHGYERLQSADYPIVWEEYPMGHEVCAAQMASISRWLQQRLAVGS